MFPNDIEHLTSHRSFMNVPTRRGADESPALACVIGIPFDCGTHPFRVGSREGPDAIRRQSHLLRPFFVDAAGAHANAVDFLRLIDLGNDQSGFGAVFEGTMQAPVLAHPGQGLVLGLRPEDVQLSTTIRQSDVSDWIEGPQVTVADIEFLGADALVTCRVGRHSLGARVRGDAVPLIGAILPTTWRKGAMHIFGRADGRRVAATARTETVPA